MPKYIIGVDGGGSKTHAMLFDDKLNLIDESFSGSANIRSDVDLAYISITMAVETLLLKHGLTDSMVKIGVGVAGYSVISAREHLLSDLQKKYQTVSLQSDCHIACVAANLDHDGAIIICGTGVVGYTVRNNIGNQIGGWGFPHGDLGGAAFLGLEICRLVCKAIDHIIPWSALLNQVYSKFIDANTYKSWLLSAKPGELAEISRFLPEYIQSDINAQAVFNLGLNEIRQFIIAVLQQNSELPLFLMGGLAIRYFPYLHNEFPSVRISEAAPALGAAYLVRNI